MCCKVNNFRNHRPEFHWISSNKLDRQSLFIWLSLDRIQLHCLMKNRVPLNRTPHVCLVEIQLIRVWHNVIHMKIIQIDVSMILSFLEIKSEQLRLKWWRHHKFTLKHTVQSGKNETSEFDFNSWFNAFKSKWNRLYSTVACTGNNLNCKQNSSDKTFT